MEILYCFSMDSKILKLDFRIKTIQTNFLREIFDFYILFYSIFFYSFFLFLHVATINTGRNENTGSNNAGSIVNICRRDQ